MGMVQRIDREALQSAPEVRQEYSSNSEAVPIDIEETDQEKNQLREENES